MEEAWYGSLCVNYNAKVDVNQYNVNDVQTKTHRSSGHQFTRVSSFDICVKPQILV